MNDRDNMYNASGGNLSIAPGTDVYDVNGDKVGSVQQYNPQANCMLVAKGRIFTKDLYIPTNAIDRITTDGIRLNLSKDDLKDNRFTSPPTSSTAGWAGTSARDEDIVGGRTTGVDDQGYPLDESTSRDRDLNP